MLVWVGTRNLLYFLELTKLAHTTFSEVANAKSKKDNIVQVLLVTAVLAKNCYYHYNSRMICCLSCDRKSTLVK